MPASIEEINSIDDPRIAPYRMLKDRELAREGDRFVAEGEYIVRRLLASDYPCESVLVIERLATEIAPIVPPNVPLYVTTPAVLRQIIGFKFHSGVMGIGKRKHAISLDQFETLKRDRATLVVCPELISAQNIGSLVRVCAALGVDGMLLGEKCCDPFWRQSIRISMGTVFYLPIIRSANLTGDLDLLSSRGFELIASVLDEKAEALDHARRADRIAILFGNESAGLDPAMIARCDRRVTIPMRQGIDSLNVTIAAGIFLYYFTRGGASFHDASGR
jgi:tRNA G18 (ribose-2'-O)-methylase SpoU